MCTTLVGQNQTLKTTVRFSEQALEQGLCLLWHELACGNFPFRIVRNTTSLNDLKFGNTTNLGLRSRMCGHSLNRTFTSVSSPHPRASCMVADYTSKLSTVMATRTKIVGSMLPTMTIPWPPLERMAVASAANQSPAMMHFSTKGGIRILPSPKAAIKVIRTMSPAAVASIDSSVYSGNIHL
jgi:hypothetical protein